ncbi:hypothetical protein CEXT_629801 [Caerostris extrusa]|uniref:Uncharacterized protein n=1 Tax=Caerostris extrusa TaxID=172846 RepID=A0AAV4V1K0_CAEEX|nr:hypothetical protein CEXT_629801 [Caerostris extrusa]
MGNVNDVPTRPRPRLRDWKQERRRNISIDNRQCKRKEKKKKELKSKPKCLEIFLDVVGVFEGVVCQISVRRNGLEDRFIGFCELRGSNVSSQQSSCCSHHLILDV